MLFRAFMFWGLFAPLALAGNIPAEIMAQQSLAPMLKSVTPAVVNISTRGVETAITPLSRDPFFGQFFGGRRVYRPTQSLGSGVVIDADNGLIVTNHHVVQNSQEISVNFQDGETLNASIVGSDRETDIALLRVNRPLTHALRAGDSDDAEVGDFVVAIGNPFGIGQTVTSGIISALNRNETSLENIAGFIQTDAAINPGNSGGALVNLQGQLIGINTAIIGPSGGNVGIGFAVPINLVLQVVDDLKRHGQVKRGKLGVTLREATPRLRQMLDLPNQNGALIENIRIGSAADLAGLEPGDLITSIDQRSVSNPSQALAILRTLRPNQQKALTFFRGDTRMTATFVLQ
ncbi:MAG: trypsin-like peptidase domain-containing protein [Gammaproteobacteria bacterium]|nr:trypsin-like peptidase domain-containing protein [Gammaproteobacteria bacterium]